MGGLWGFQFALAAADQGLRHAVDELAKAVSRRAFVHEKERKKPRGPLDNVLSLSAPPVVGHCRWAGVVARPIGHSPMVALEDPGGRVEVLILEGTHFFLHLKVRGLQISHSRQGRPRRQQMNWGETAGFSNTAKRSVSTSSTTGAPQWPWSWSGK